MKIVTKDTIIEAIQTLTKCDTIASVEKILDDYRIDKRDRVNEKRYPSLSFTITRDEIEIMEEQGVLIDGNINSDAICEKDPLTKLLYALAWKNGDLHKLHHIVHGIKNDNSNHNPKNGIVFYHFGKFLTGTSPIIDQHVIRCFEIVVNNSDSVLKEVNHKHATLIADYKKWLGDNLSQELKNESNYLYHVDKVFFALGKSYKRHSL